MHIATYLRPDTIAVLKLEELTKETTPVAGVHCCHIDSRGHVNFSAIYGRRKYNRRVCVLYTYIGQHVTVLW